MPLSAIEFYFYFLLKDGIVKQSSNYGKVGLVGKIDFIVVDKTYDNSNIRSFTKFERLFDRLKENKENCDAL